MTGLRFETIPLLEVPSGSPKLVTGLFVMYRTALILQWYRRRMGITVVRAMARHRWRHSQYVGLTRVQLEHSRRRADREHQRQAREQAERRSEEVVRMAQEHYFPWRPEW